jgi:hypothetical protein
MSQLLEMHDSSLRRNTLLIHGKQKVLALRRDRGVGGSPNFQVALGKLGKSEWNVALILIERMSFGIHCHQNKSTFSARLRSPEFYFKRLPDVNAANVLAAPTIRSDCALSHIHLRQNFVETALGDVLIQVSHDTRRVSHNQKALSLVGAGTDKIKPHLFGELQISSTH